MTRPSTNRRGPRANIAIKRAYAPPEPKDGVRVLVDGLWPRGLRKEEARIDIWLKEIAPSAELRRWFHHDPMRWNEFQRRYRAELSARKANVDMLSRLADSGPVTLLFGSADVDHNNAVALKNLLQRRGRAAR